MLIASNGQHQNRIGIKPRAKRTMNRITTGMETFEAKCTACHKMGKRFVGPDLTGVTDRREPEWIMNMILDPELMVKENEAAKALLAEYLSPMANQSLTEEEARSILEYFRTVK